MIVDNRRKSIIYCSLFIYKRYKALWPDPPARGLDP
jgi:hypothetical protein